MAINNDHTVHPILKEQSYSEILTTLNHNFQVLTERIKDLNISLSYLDALKITAIFKLESDDPDQNLQNFVSQCWNTLANYAGVYFNNNSSNANRYFTWMSKYHVKAGDFIIKLPNDQSLYLPGPQPKYMVPTVYDAKSHEITFTPAKSAAAQVIELDLSNVPTARLGVHDTVMNTNTVISGDYQDCRFYTYTDGNDDNNGEEIFFVDYRPGNSFKLPIKCRVQYLEPIPEPEPESVGE